MNLHKEFYNFRERVWNELENLVHNGCNFIGKFPTVIGEIELKGNTQRGGMIISDTTSIVIHGIVKNENYFIHPEKQSDKDIDIITNKIMVIKRDGTKIEVEPDLLDLQELSTYLSGGFSAYDN